MDPFTTPSAASATVVGESRDELNRPQRKIRLACDRCHSQKLRCVKKQREVGCERCLKLHTACRYGPRAPRASLKPPQSDVQCDWYEPPSVPAAIPMPNAHSYPAVANGSSSEWLFSPDIDAGITEEQVAAMQPSLCYPMLGEPADMNNFWPDPFCGQGNANLLDQYGSLDVINQDQFRDAFPSSDTSDGHPRVDNNDYVVASPASTIQVLANLNVALYDCAAKLPSMPEAGVNTRGIGSHRRGSQKRTTFAIDDLFRLTSEFTYVVKRLSREACDTSTISPPEDSNPSSTEALPVVAYNQQLSHLGLGASKIGSGRPLSHIDEGTMLMIMSCHCRLTEIYLSIFQMMQACIEYSIAPRKEEDWALILPRLQMGSHSAPPIQVDANTSLSSATTSMYMVMVTMLSSQLCEKLTDVMGVGDEGIGGGGGGVHLRGQGVDEVDEGPLSPSQCLFAATVMDRTKRLERTIDATKHLLQRFSLVAE